MSIADIVAFLWRAKFTLIIGGIAGAALGVTYAMVATPVYRAEVLLAQTDNTDLDIPGGSLLDTVGGFAGFRGLAASTARQKYEGMAILESDNFIAAYIEEKGLLQRLYEDRWNGGSGTWIGDEEKHPTINEGVDYFQRNVLSVFEDDRTGFVTVRVDWKERFEAAEWANDLVRRVNREGKKREQQEAQEAIRFLNEELEKTQVIELRNSLYGLLETQISKIMLTNVRDEYLFTVLDRAVVPDEDDIVRPKRALVAITATVLGGLIALFVALFRAAWAGSQASRNETSH